MANDRYKDNYEVIIVDNGSDNPALMQDIAAKYNYRLIRSNKNLAFSYANELGIKEAKSDNFILLNDDTIPHKKGWIKDMLEFNKNNPQCGVQGVKLLFPNSENIQHCGVAFNQNRQPFHYLLNTNIHDDRTTKAKEFQAVTFACVLITRECYEAVGGFTHGGEEPAYWYEDIDFCLKARIKGYQVWYNPDVVLYHYSSVSMSKINKTSADTFKHFAAFKKKWFDEIENDDYYLEHLPDDSKVVMIGIPLSEGSKWIFPRLMNMIEGFHYWKQNIIIMLSLSNCGETFVEEIKQYAMIHGRKYKDFLLTTKAPHFGDGQSSIIYNREQIRNEAIKHKVDYLFFIDSDVSMERDTLKRLVKVCETEKCEISAGAYFYKLEDMPKPMLFHKKMETKEFKQLGMKEKQIASTDMFNATNAIGNFAFAMDLFENEGVYEAGAVNMGCTLISKKAFDIPFEKTTSCGSEDIGWFQRAAEKGYRLMVDTSLKLFHVDKNGYVYCFWNLPLDDGKYKYYLKPQKEAITA
jgi:GT2 family glycosyltransferase